MGALFGSLSALCIGLSDLFGRRVAEASNSVATSAAMQTLAAVTALGSVAVVSSQLAWADMVLGAVSGLGMGTGLACYYRGMTLSSSAVVAPVVATLAAVIPYGYTLITGSTPSAVAVIGATVAFVGLVLVTLGDRAPARMRVGLTWALASGLGYALAQTVLIETSSASGSWPGVSQRLVALVSMMVVARVIRVPFVPPPGLRRPAVVAGILAGFATVFFLAGVQLDAQPAVVTSSMFPAATVAIGWVFFRDHLARVQVVGIGVVLVGITGVVSP